MSAIKLGKDFGKPIGQPDSYHVKCQECGRVEGQFVYATNRLMVGTGAYADKFKERGWRFEGSDWTCPSC